MDIEGFKYEDKAILDYIRFSTEPNTTGDKIQTVEYEAHIDSRLCPDFKDATCEALKLLDKKVVVVLLGDKYNCVMTDLYINASEWKIEMTFTGSKISNDNEGKDFAFKHA